MVIVRKGIDVDKKKWEDFSIICHTLNSSIRKEIENFLDRMIKNYRTNLEMAKKGEKNG